MILNWKKVKRRIENGELCHAYWSDWHKALTFVFSDKPVIVRTRRKKIVNLWKQYGFRMWVKK